jgi:hypothetical protein
MTSSELLIIIVGVFIGYVIVSAFIGEKKEGPTYTEKNNPCSKIGVTSNMTNDEIKHYLNSEYMKWNSRTENPDPIICKQAVEMLTLISECRKRHF